MNTEKLFCLPAQKPALYFSILFFCVTHQKTLQDLLAFVWKKMKRFSCFVRNLIHSHRWPSSGVILIMR